MKHATEFRFGVILFVIPLIFCEIFHRKLNYRLGDLTEVECLSGNMCPVIRTTCAMMCESSAQCASFNYRPSDGVCQLNNHHMFEFAAEATPSDAWEYFGPKQQDVKDDDWILAFLAKSGIKVPIMDVWNANGLAHDLDLGSQDPALFSKYVANSSTHYRSHWLDVWGSTSILQVRLVLYKNGIEVVSLLFDGNGSTKDDWFSKPRLISSPWSDLTGVSPAVFSVSGQIMRKFYISTSASYFDCHDNKWLLVLSTQANMCTFEKYDGPQFLYSTGTTSSDFENGGYGLAETMAIFIKIA
ncbi:uncharacterized protein LOC121382312 [Gigantopelta aegis]|uniref:uncharacterized protein LOC121382312 n=1 Tax=Gigantopelta aegis TaxID=1735272 RepID=UPI001B887AC2|nr:uncharacterized protein LOC121382312 [Gigantopelta aegis]